jgi:hypothetical protein
MKHDLSDVAPHNMAEALSDAGERAAAMDAQERQADAAVDQERLGALRAALQALAAKGGDVAEIAKQALHRDEYLQYAKRAARHLMVEEPIWDAWKQAQPEDHEFKVGDKVTFVNDGRMVYPGKTITGIDASGASPRYYFAPTDTPWFAVPARNLRPAEGAWANTYPRSCPITQRPYVLTVEHPDLGLVPMYGGPLDLYTIPHLEGEASLPMHERPLACFHFNLETNCWVAMERLSLRIVEEEVLAEVLEPKDGLARTERPAGG